MPSKLDALARPVGLRLVPVVALSAVLLASCADAKESEEAKVTEPAPVAAMQADDLPLYYNVSNNDDQLRLIHLGEMVEDGSAVVVPVTSASRKPEKFGMGEVWRLHCGQEAMEILQAIPIGPGHVGNMTTFDQPQQVRARATAENWEIYRLGCDGDAQLDPRRVIMDDPSRDDELMATVEIFWR